MSDCPSGRKFLDSTWTARGRESFVARVVTGNIPPVATARPLSPKTTRYSAENGGVSWPAPLVAKRPRILNAPTAAQAVAPPVVVLVGQHMPRRDPGTVASASASYRRW